eukprot:scaffold33956_cov29-Tisochrysis_lutea.AAC.3
MRCRASVDLPHPAPPTKITGREREMSCAAIAPREALSVVGMTIGAYPLALSAAGTIAVEIWPLHATQREPSTSADWPAAQTRALHQSEKRERWSAAASDRSAPPRTHTAANAKWAWYRVFGEPAGAACSVSEASNRLQRLATKPDAHKSSEYDHPCCAAASKKLGTTVRKAASSTATAFASRCAGRSRLLSQEVTQGCQPTVLSSTQRMASRVIVPGVALASDDASTRKRIAAERRTRSLDTSVSVLVSSKAEFSDSTQV